MKAVLTLPTRTGATRGVWLLTLERLADWPDDLDLPSPMFHLLVACDARYVAAEQIACFVEKVLDQGVAYLCLWGRDSDRIVTAFEQAEALRHLDAPLGEPWAQVSWHGTQPLQETVWYFLECAVADPAFQDLSQSWVAAAVGEPRWHEQIRAAIERLGGARSDRT